MNIRNSSAGESLRVDSSQPAQLSSELRQRLTGLVGSAADEVSLSDFSSALKAADSNSPQQTARVAEIAGAVANQSYRIDSPAVSERIVNEHLRA